MSSLVGLRVVRGPDWKWGEQDGGEGTIGTVTSLSPSTESKPGTVTVAWDSGSTGQYRGGPENCYDLRIVFNNVLGAKHPDIVCNGLCPRSGPEGSRLIRGIRWKCTKCNENFCTTCYLKRYPHNEDHWEFVRYSGTGANKPFTVAAWDENGPDGRIRLMGMFPCAKVSLRPSTQNEQEIGEVVYHSRPSCVLVKWPLEKETIRYEWFDAPQLFAKRLAYGGLYFPDAFPRLRVPKFRHPQVSAYSFGDRVRINPDIDTEELKMKQSEHGVYDSDLEFLIGIAGTVSEVDESDVTVIYQHAHWNGSSFKLNPAVISKVNKYSVGQVIRIRNDRVTIKEIRNKFPIRLEAEMLEGAIGYVTVVDEHDAEQVCIQFANDKIYKWLSKAVPLPSRWMDKYETAHPSSKDLIQLAAQQDAQHKAKRVALFFKAVASGDLVSVQLLFTKVRDVDVLMKSKTALHVASKYGHKDVVKWLLDVANAQLEKRDQRGYRALHYAADNANEDVLEMLIERGAELNTQTRLGKTALYLAVGNQFTNCIRALLAEHGCDINLQDVTGNGPLHHAIASNVTLKVIKALVSSGRINWKLRNKAGYNVLHLAVLENNLELVRFLLETSKKTGLLYELTEKEKNSALHIASVLKFSEMAKLLVQEAESGERSKFEKFLHAKDINGSTSLLISCHQKDYATVELLIKAGANLQDCDKDNDTAIIFASYETLGFIVAPILKEAPSIYASYRRQKPAIRKMMEKHPILFLILYLIEHGCNWDAINKHGETATIILRENGYQDDVINVINNYAAEQEKKSRKIRDSARPSQQSAPTNLSSSEEDAN